MAEQRTAPIAPALAREQWASGVVEHQQYAITLRDGQLVLHGVSTSVHVPAALRPALAALALHGQPNGFTHEDLRALGVAWEHARGDPMQESRIASLMRRLHALLPPEDLAR